MRKESKCILNLFAVSPMVTSVYPDSSQLNYTVDMTAEVTFVCVGTGIPPPSITWYRNGTELDSNDTRVTFNDAFEVAVMDNEEIIYSSVIRALMLNMTEDGDSGIYECRASNEATPGEDSMAFELIVQSK